MELKQKFVFMSNNVFFFRKIVTLFMYFIWVISGCPFLLRSESENVLCIQAK